MDGWVSGWLTVMWCCDVMLCLIVSCRVVVSCFAVSCSCRAVLRVIVLFGSMRYVGMICRVMQFVFWRVVRCAFCLVIQLICRPGVTVRCRALSCDPWSSCLTVFCVSYSCRAVLCRVACRPLVLHAVRWYGVCCRALPCRGSVAGAVPPVWCQRGSKIVCMCSCMCVWFLFLALQGCHDRHAGNTLFHAHHSLTAFHIQRSQHSYTTLSHTQHSHAHNTRAQHPHSHTQYSLTEEHTHKSNTQHLHTPLTNTHHSQTYITHTHRSHLHSHNTHTATHARHSHAHNSHSQHSYINKKFNEFG